MTTFKVSNLKENPSIFLRHAPPPASQSSKKLASLLFEIRSVFLSASIPLNGAKSPLPVFVGALRVLSEIKEFSFYGQ